MTGRAIQVIDLGFGDSGKGTMVDYLVRRHEADLVVRFNGGPQAGHNVVLPDGRHHTFAQFGSGSFVDGVRTLLSRFMLIEPYAMLNEADHLASIGVSDILSRTLIDERCLVITPPQQIANRLRERARGTDAHGTCGMGVGECMADSIEHPDLSIFAGDLCDRAVVRAKLRAMLDFKRDSLASHRFAASESELRVLDDPAWIEAAVHIYASIGTQAKIISAADGKQILREAKCAIYEGAQGVLLDERYGFHPHTTWSKTTFTNADMLVSDAQVDARIDRIGVMRTYLTRHGSGPFAEFDERVTAHLPEPHNLDVGWQGAFRRGPLDLVLLRYAIEVCGGVDGLAITHLDRLPQLPEVVCDSYEIQGEITTSIRHESKRDTHHAEPFGDWPRTFVRRYRNLPTRDLEAFIAAIETALSARVAYRSKGPTFLDKR